MKISVVIPVYNAEKRLKKCIKSVQNQSFSDLEIILVDDGSKDKSGKICDKEAELDQRIRVIHQFNQGSVAARRTGVENATGEYICFCDADDMLPRTALANLLNGCKDADICVGKMERLWRNIHFQSKYVPLCFQKSKKYSVTHEEFIEKLYCSWFGISNVPVNLCGKLFKTEIIKKVYNDMIAEDEHIFWGDDLIVTLNAMPIAKRITFLTDTVYHYRLGGGTTKYSPSMLNDFLELYRYKVPFIEKYSMPQETQIYADIELCNVVFSYFNMLKNAKECSDEQLKCEIKKVCELPEVHLAASNQNINRKNHNSVLMISSKDIDKIYDFVSREKRDYLREIIKKVIYAIA